MTKVQLITEVAPELARRVEIDAVSSARSISDWIEDVIRRELQNDVEANANHLDRESLPPNSTCHRQARSPEVAGTRPGFAAARQ